VIGLFKSFGKWATSAIATMSLSSIALYFGKECACFFNGSADTAKNTRHLKT
jgi:hypothetical protein